MFISTQVYPVRRAGTHAAVPTLTTPITTTLLAAAADGDDGRTSLPIRITIALIVVIGSWLLSRLIQRFGEPLLAKRRTPSFGRVISALIGYLVVTIAFFVAAVIVFPSFKPVDVLAGLGIFSIAIGFAFQDILSNLLAGILLLIREPFEGGDQIEVVDQRGTVERITIRETQIRTFDGEKVVIPNAQVYQNVIRVQTAYGPKRTTLTIGLDDWEDHDRAADVVLEAVRGIEGVATDPAPEAYFLEFGSSVTNMELRYWTDPRQAEVRRVQDQVVRRVGRSLRDANIPMPSPITEIDIRPSVWDHVAELSDGDAADGRP